MSEGPETAAFDGGEEYGQSEDTYSTHDISWMADLPGPNAEFAYAKGWESPLDLVRQFRDLEAMVGPDQVRMPGADATPEEINAFWSRMGRPETPDGYNIAPGDSASGYDSMLADWFRDAAHAVHMPADMAESLHDRFREQAAEASAGYWQQAEQERQESEAVLRHEWGRGFDARIEDAQRRSPGPDPRLRRYGPPARGWWRQYRAERTRHGRALPHRRRHAGPARNSAPALRRQVHGRLRRPHAPQPRHRPGTDGRALQCRLSGRHGPAIIFNTKEKH